MCSRSAIRRVIVMALLAAVPGGCSEYFDRRDTVTLYSGEAMAANRVTQTIDPWPAASGNRNFAYDGQKAATAAERYRTGKVIPPQSPMTASSYNQPQQAPSDSGGNNQNQSGQNSGGNNNGAIK